MTQQPDAPSISSDSGSASPEDDVALAEVFITRRCCGGGLCRNIAPSIFGEVRPHEADEPGLALIEGSWEPGAFTGVICQPRTWPELDAARTAAAGCGFNPEFRSSWALSGIRRGVLPGQRVAACSTARKV